MTLSAHGGELVNTVLSTQESTQILKQLGEYFSLDLNERQVCDLELISCGAFSPLKGFMNQKDYLNVVSQMRLSDQTLWPLPITLDISEQNSSQCNPGTTILLRDPEGLPLALLDITDQWKADKVSEAKHVFGTTDKDHPGVHYLYEQSKPFYIGGCLRTLQLPNHYDFRQLRDTPKQLREKFKKLGWKKIVAFQTRNPLHRAHFELTFKAALNAEANLLIHPVVGQTKPGDVDHFTRVHCYEALMQRYPKQTTTLSLIPLAMRMAGPREALWHAIIRRNYGCTHFIIGRDHAGPGNDRHGEPFYGAYEAQELVEKYRDELSIEVIPFKMMVYVQNKESYLPVDEIKDEDTVLTISGTDLRDRLEMGRAIPDWYSFPEVIAVLQKRYPPRWKQGFTVFFTGLSGAGKSTIANALQILLMQQGDRPVTLLDGDIVRKNLSSELGFSREHRNINILRIGYVASEITKNRGVAICAPIAPYAETRLQVRQLIQQYGAFVEIHISTSLEVCESRDRKGLYALARAGKISEFTGVSDPYEIPKNPELVIDTQNLSPEESAQSIFLKLEA
ncbi:MAG: bifunctional sulfate adenylyltransferase/adenylylsulfate kinase, partial [bacterium]